MRNKCHRNSVHSTFLQCKSCLFSAKIAQIAIKSLMKTDCLVQRELFSEFCLHCLSLIWPGLLDCVKYENINKDCISGLNKYFHISQSIYYCKGWFNDLTIGWQNLNPLSHPNATLAQGLVVKIWTRGIIWNRHP